MAHLLLSSVLPHGGGGFMKFLATSAIIGITLLAATPAVRNQSLWAQADKQPTERPKPQQPAGGQQQPRRDPPTTRPEAPKAERPSPPPPPPPQSTGEPELKRRKQ